MGISWSNARSCKNNTLLVLTAPLPADKEHKDPLFSLWKANKEALKKDGFQIGKNKFKGNQWEATYFHKVSDTTYEKSTNGKRLWEIEFTEKINKWVKVLEDAKVKVEAIDPEDIGVTEDDF